MSRKVWYVGGWQGDGGERRKFCTMRRDRKVRIPLLVFFEFDRKRAQMGH